MKNRFGRFRLIRMQTGIAWVDTRGYEKQFLVYTRQRYRDLGYTEGGRSRNTRSHGIALVKFRYCKARLKIDETWCCRNIVVGITRYKYSTNKSSRLLLSPSFSLSLSVSAYRAEPLSRVLIVIYITSRAYENSRLQARA